MEGQAGDPAWKAPQGYESRVRDGFGSQAFMGTLGARMVQVSPGRVVVEMPVRDDLAQQHGYVHAGAVTSIADSACGWAAFTLMPPGSGVVSVEFKVNLLRPAVGERLRATGTVLRPGHTLTVTQGEVWALSGDEWRQVAVMVATMMRLGPSDREG